MFCHGNSLTASLSIKESHRHPSPSELQGRGKKVAFGVRWVLVAAFMFAIALPCRADQSQAKTAEEANSKCVKLFGSGGFRGLAAYGTGVLVSEDGYIVTIASHILETRDLRVHLADGRRYSQVKVVAIEPVLDLAVLKIDGVSALPYFDVFEAARKPLTLPGTPILAFTNEFEIATRNEPVSVQRGVVSAYSKLQGNKGVFLVPYVGEVYFVDAICNNPGSAGGALTTRRGELIGIIGKEVQNQLTATWINYAIPVQATGKGKRKGQDVTVSVADMLDTILVQKKPYESTELPPRIAQKDSYSGLVLVPNVLERTPPYVEDVDPSSPAARAGLKPDDLIVYVDGIQVISIEAYHNIVDFCPPGTELTLEVQRGNKLETIKLKLIRRPGSETKKPEPKK